MRRHVEDTWKGSPLGPLIFKKYSH